MDSLKSALPYIAPVLETTADALYGRQRKLTQIGLLPVAAGRGPGSGTPFTTETLGILLISVLAADSPSDIDKRLIDLCRAEERTITGQVMPSPRSFRECVTEAIDDQIAGGKRMIMRIGVTRYWRGEISSVQRGGRTHDRIFLIKTGFREMTKRPAITTTRSFELKALLDILRPFLQRGEEQE